jgi:hypothetical protein
MLQTIWYIIKLQSSGYHNCAFNLFSLPPDHKNYKSNPENRWSIDLEMGK